MLSILLVGELGSRLDSLAALLSDAGHNVERLAAERLLHLDTLIQVMQPNMVLIDYSDPMRDSVEQFCVHSSGSDSPLLVLAQAMEADLSSQLRQAGLAVYTGMGTEIAQVAMLLPVLDMMAAREQKLRNQVDELKQELSDRRDIERAKELLAKKMQCSSEEAFKALRQKAMQNRCSMGELARTLLKQLG